MTIKKRAPIALTKIPSTVTKVDVATGEEVVEGMAWNILPPLEGRCKICGIEHRDDYPHNAQSLYYQMTFGSMHGRAPTWADAIAHCPENVKAHWKTVLGNMGQWSEPPAGERPIAHHGID